MPLRLRAKPSARKIALRGPRIELRPLTEADLTDAYVGWLNDPEVTRYLTIGGTTSTRESLRAYFERFRSGRSDWLFAIIERASGRHIGNVTINHLHPRHRIADTGLMIGCKECWGRGYAYETWRLVIRHAFERLGARKLIAGAVEDNTASIATLEKLGFKREGVLRGEFLLDGRPRDLIRFGLFQDEFEAAAKTPRRTGARR